jgi:flagellar biosynthesis/type III secretory pathway M-ring protein FliF/YscJ
VREALMQIAIVILALALLAVVLFVVSAPLRAAGTGTEEVVSSPERDELEAAREAKYREIRDAELDMRTGKLSSADYESIDGALRAEALEILDRLQVLDASDRGAAPGDASDGDAPAHGDGDASAG